MDRTNEVLNVEVRMNIRRMSLSELREYIRTCNNDDTLAYALAVYEAKKQMGAL